MKMTEVAGGSFGRGDRDPKPGMCLALVPGVPERVPRRKAATESPASVGKGARECGRAGRTRKGSAE